MMERVVTAKELELVREYCLVFPSGWLNKKNTGANLPPADILSIIPVLRFG
jgi:hypothetical protein